MWKLNPQKESIAEFNTQVIPKKTNIERFSSPVHIDLNMNQLVRQENSKSMDTILLKSTISRIWNALEIH